MGRFAVIAGGGTAGHVHPGLAVARALVDRGHDASSILYVGSEHGIERELVPAAGFELMTVPGRGIPRQLSFGAVKAGASLIRGVGVGLRLLGRERPAVVLSLGGFAAIPCAIGARIRRIPVVIHEQNAVPGAANRLIGRWARAAAVSFPNTPLPHAVLTGNPVRTEMLAVDRQTQRADARARLGVEPGRRLVVVTGGSLGALRLNEAALDAAEHWAERDDICLRHIIGERDWDILAPRRASLGGALQYQAVRYEADMPAVFAAADVVLSRAGASTTSEIAIVGVPSVLIPLPGAPGDHQTANAQALVDVGAARLIRDVDFGGGEMASMVDELLSDPVLLDTMGHAARSVGRPDAAEQVAILLEEHAA